MSTQSYLDATGDLSPAELNLGKVLALVQRVLPRLEEAYRANEVQSALQRAGAFLEAARQAHAQSSGVGHTTSTGPAAPEIIAAISAAISIVLSSPYRLLSVQKVVGPVPQANVWAVEGRTQIFQSHKVR